MDGIRKRLMFSHKLRIVLLGCICLLGCTTPKQIIRPDVGELSSRVMEGTINKITIQAAILDSEQTERLFNIDLARRSVIPVLFVITNKSTIGLTLRREHFAARIGLSRIEPALPGRAAALLRDISGSRSAAWAGWALLGILAVPSIDAADKTENMAIEGHREAIFSFAHLPPGDNIAGYLFFESPVSPNKLKVLGLEYCLSGNRNDLTTVQLVNPYAKDIGN